MGNDTNTMQLSANMTAYRSLISIPNKAKNKLSFKSSNNFENNLKKTIAWFLYNKKEWNE